MFFHSFTLDREILSTPRTLVTVEVTIAQDALLLKEGALNLIVDIHSVPYEISGYAPAHALGRRCKSKQILEVQRIFEQISANLYETFFYDYFLL